MSLGSRSYWWGRKTKQCEGQVQVHLWHHIDSRPFSAPAQRGHCCQLLRDASRSVYRADCPCVPLSLPSGPWPVAEPCRDIRTAPHLHLIWNPELISSCLHATGGQAGLWVCRWSEAVGRVFVPVCGWRKDGLGKLSVVASSPGPVHSQFTQQRGLCRCNSVEDLEMGKLSWMVWVGQCHHKGPERAEIFSPAVVRKRHDMEE